MESAISLNIRELSEEEVCNFVSGNKQQVSTDWMAIDFDDGNGATGTTFYEKHLIKTLGLPYIFSHASIRRSRLSGIYTLYISKDDYYNNAAINPPRTVMVQRVQTVVKGCMELYRGIADKRFFLRIKENDSFAKWYVCEGSEKHSIRPNITFQCGAEKETVVYHDWCETAATRETFNPNFQ